MVQGDGADTACLEEAIRGCDHAFFVLPGSPDQGELEPGIAAAAAVGRAVGRDVTHVPVPDEAAREGLLGAGIPTLYADALLELFAWYRTGGGAGVSPDVQDVLGRPARSFDEWARDHADAFS